MTFFECSVSNFSAVKSNSLLALATAFPLSVWPHSDTGISTCKARTSTGTCRLRAQQRSIPVISESITTQTTLRHCSSPLTQSTQGHLCAEPQLLSGALSTSSLGSRAPVWLDYLTSATLHHTIVLHREVMLDAQEHLMLACTCPAEGGGLASRNKTGEKAHDKLLWCVYSSVQLCSTPGPSPSSFYWAQTPMNSIWKTGRSL